MQSDSNVLLELYKQKQQLLNEIGKLQSDPNAVRLPVSQLANIIPKGLKINCNIQLDRNTVHI